MKCRRALRLLLANLVVFADEQLRQLVRDLLGEDGIVRRETHPESGDLLVTAVPHEVDVDVFAQRLDLVVRRFQPLRVRRRG